MKGNGARRFGSLVAALSGLVAAAGCGSSSADGEVRVAAGFYPLAYVAERVAGDRAAVDDLTQPGDEPHDLELPIAQTAALAEADLVVHLSGFQPEIDESVDQNATGATVDAAAAVALSDEDPHFWHDPRLMADLADAVAAELVRIDPGGEADYLAGARALRSDLEELDTAYADGLTDCARSTVVVSHDAFGYLGRYGLTLAPIAGLSPDAEPTPADLQRLQGLIRTTGITTVFSETLTSPELAETLANDLGVSTGVLDPIEGLGDQTADEDYLSLMRANLAALREANGC